MAKEIWRDIPGYGNDYQASSYGRIKSIGRMSIQGHWLSTKILKVRVNDKYGHLYVNLFKNGKCVTHQVHRLIARTFIGPCPKGMEVRHYPDRNPWNNKIKNLRYGTRKENRADSKIHGTEVRGEKHFRAKFTEKIILEMRRLYEIRLPSGKRKYTQKQIGIKFDTTQSVVGDIINRKRWKHI